MAADVLQISDKSQEKLLAYITACYLVRDEGWQLRNRLEEADRAYMRESDFSEEQLKASLANKMGDKTKLQNMQVPMVMESVENTTGFLSNVFCTDYPLFKFVSDPDKQDLALMWNTLVGEDQIYYGWAGEFNIAFRCGAKYNFAPIEVEWCSRRRFKPRNGTGNKGVALEQVVYEGNRIRALDPYNLIYDPRVPIHKVHEKGEFVGYVEPMGRIELKTFLASLGQERLKNDVRAFQAGDWGVAYYVPQINRNVLMRNKNWLQGAFDWTKWIVGGVQDHIQYQNMYSVATLYCRIMPYDFGIRAPKDQTPDIWKLIAVNGILVYAQPMVNAHDMLPIVIAQPKVDIAVLSHQVKSQAENQIPFQEMTSALWNAKLQSARRRTTDRMIYNPLLIDPDHINTPNPSAKIPIRPTAYGRKLEEAVYVIPFDDANSQYFIQEAEGVAKWGMRVDGRNNVSMGQFQKGNKLNDEYHDTMANAGLQDRTQALMWENFAMVPVKIMMKSNYLQFAPTGKKYNRVEGKAIDIDPVKLREAEADFEVGDGLLPTQRLARTDVIQNGLQFLQGDPATRAGYDMAPLFSYIMKVQGVDKLAKFEKDPAQRQYEQALQAWQAVSAEYTKMIGKEMSPGKFVTPEDIQKFIGPMPQSPQQQQQQQQQGTPPNARP
jgi:hypothetical protein